MNKFHCLLFLFFLSFCQIRATDLPDSTRFQKLSNSRLVHFFTGHKYLISPYLLYMPETNWVFGAGVKRFLNAGGENDTLTRVSNTAVFLQYSLNQQIIFEHNYQIFTNKEKYYVFGFYGFSRFPVYYYGAGKDARLENQEQITYDLIRFDNLTLRKIRPYTFAGLGWRFFNMYNIHGQPNGIMEKENVSGSQGSRVSGLNASVLYDSRDNVLTTSNGIFAQIEFSYHAGFTGSTHNFQRWMIDLRKFIKPFKNREDVIAFQAYSMLNNGDVPFNELGLLGGDMIMRGYYLGSYRDKNLLAFQGEYRLQVLKRWGLAGFAGMGKVDESISGLNFQNVLPSYGAGLRFKINRKENVNLRIDYGFGNGQQNLYFFIAEAF